MNEEHFPLLAQSWWECFWMEKFTGGLFTNVSGRSWFEKKANAFQWPSSRKSPLRPLTGDSRDWRSPNFSWSCTTIHGQRTNGGGKIRKSHYWRVVTVGIGRLRQYEDGMGRICWTLLFRRSRRGRRRGSERGNLLETVKKVISSSFNLSV